MWKGRGGGGVPPPAGWYASPSGDPGNAGTYASPWDLQTALDGGSASEVQPGDTIWLRGGSYTGVFTSSVSGSFGTGLQDDTTKVHIKKYPGERPIIDHTATLDNMLTITGDYTWWWEIEFTDSNKASTEGTLLNTVDIQGNGHKMISCIVHDGHDGIFGGSTATNLELHGCLSYYNGALSTEHGIYAQNTSPTKTFVGNIVFHNFGYGFHCHAGGGDIRYFNVFRNAAIQNGMLAGATSRNANIYFHNPGAPNAMQGMDVEQNHTYDVDSCPSSAGQIVFDNDLVNLDVICSTNYLVGATPLYMAGFTTVGVENNIVVPREGVDSFVVALQNAGSPDPNTWTVDNNTYIMGYTTTDPQRWNYKNTLYTFTNWQAASGLDAASTFSNPAGHKPTTTDVFVYPNYYIAGRGHVYIYNWTSANTVSVDVSTILTNGDSYEVRYYQDYFATPCLSGTYGGGNLSFPMTGLTVATPVAFTGMNVPDCTAPEFGAFVVRKV